MCHGCTWRLPNSGEKDSTEHCEVSRRLWAAGQSEKRKQPGKRSAACFCSPISSPLSFSVHILLSGKYHIFVSYSEQKSQTNKDMSLSLHIAVSSILKVDPDTKEMLKTDIENNHSIKITTYTQASLTKWVPHRKSLEESVHKSETKMVSWKKIFLKFFSQINFQNHKFWFNCNWTVQM